MYSSSFLLFLLINLFLSFSSPQKLYHFVTVKAQKNDIITDNNNPVSEDSTISSDQPPSPDASKTTETFVFHTKNRSKKSNIIDHFDGTTGFPKTIYFLKNNILKIVPNIETFHHLGLDEKKDLEEISESEFSTYQFQLDTLSHSHLPVINPSYQGLDTLVEIEIKKSQVLQGIQLYNITYLGEYLNPAITFFQNRILLATGLAWFEHDNHAANEHIEFRWINDSILPFHHYSGQRQVYLTEQEEKEDPNPNDTYYRGVDEQHVAPMSKRILIGQDPRMIAISMTEAYIVYTNRFNNPTTMGGAFFCYNETTDQLEIIAHHNNLRQGEETRTAQKNWSPFLVPLSSLSTAEEEEANNTHHHPHHHPHSHLQSHQVHYSKDLFLIQHFQPFTVYRIHYEEMKSREYNGRDVTAKLFSKSLDTTIFNWNYGHLRGGTNAVYLPKYHQFLTFFHSSRIIPGNAMTTYVFGAITFTATLPFTVTAITLYPIMPEIFYTGPWDPLKNRRIDYVVFPMSCLLFDHDEKVLLSFGHLDVRGYMATLVVEEILKNMETVGENEHPYYHYPARAGGDNSTKSSRKKKRKKRI